MVATSILARARLRVRACARPPAPTNSQKYPQQSSADLEADRSRYWTEGSESVMSLRELAKLKRDGKINHEEFSRLRNRAIAAADEDA